MKNNYRTLPLWIIGLLVLGFSVVGTCLVLGRRIGDGPDKEEPRNASPAPAGDGAVCIGYVDVETRGELTRGMSVIDLSPRPAGAANVELATDVDVAAVRMYIKDVLASSI